MHPAIRVFGIALLALILLGAGVLLLNPSARQLVPSWLAYDWFGSRFAPAPAEVEQYVLVSGQDYCSVGRDSDCGGYKLVGARALAVGPAARQAGTAAAWCIDYAVLRRNQSRLTGGLIYWAAIPRAMVVTQSSAGQYDALDTGDCRTAVLP
jgi:hypothetical protein